MKSPEPIHKGPTTEKISALFRRISETAQRCRKARNKQPKDSLQSVMLAGKVKAYVEVLILFHAKYPHHIEAGLWEESINSTAKR